MTPVRLESAAPRSRVEHSTTKPLRSPYLESTISNLASCTISIVYLVFVAEQVGLSPIQLETMKTGFDNRTLCRRNVIL